MGRGNQLKSNLTYGKHSTRQLWLLRGVAGAGKSTFIEEWGLENYVISTDNFRMLLTNPKMNEIGFRLTDNNISHKAFEYTYEFIEERCKNGVFTVVDNMNLAVKQFESVIKIGEKYGYKIYVIDFDMDLNTLKERNKLRYGTVKYFVDEEQFARKLEVKNQNNNHVKKKYEVIDSRDKENIKELLCGNFENIDYYDEVKIIGDIHGCYTVLKEALGEFKSKTKYIFLGDLIDRGIENQEVLEYLIKNFVGKRNVEFIEGNHDIYLNAYVNGVDLGYGREFIRHTQPQLDTINKKDIKKLVKRLKSYYAFEFNNKKYFCCHGGVLYDEMLSLYSENELIYGVGDYSYNVDKKWNSMMVGLEEKERVTQFHGHRNSLKVGLDDYLYSYNLEDNVERGGNLRVATIDKTGVRVIAYKNTVYNKDRYTKSEKAVEEFILQAKENNKLIKIKPQDVSDNIVSVNFSSKVFYDGLWNDLTTKARGIFIDTSVNKVILRGYNKFFNIGEYDDIETIVKDAKYPIRAYSKENGYLGMVSYNKDLDSFIYGTKSNLITDDRECDLAFVNEIKTIFDKQFSDKEKEYLKEYLIFNDVTLTFEVISLKDKHMVGYTEDELVLLDIIKNTMEFNKFEYSKVLELSEKLNVRCKEVKFQFKNEEQLLNILKYNINKDSSRIEGYVFEDKDYQVMFKYKSWHYGVWKGLRTVFQQSHKLTEEEFKNKLDSRFDKLLNIYKDNDVAIKYINDIKGYDFYKLMTDKYKYMNLLGVLVVDIPLIIDVVEDDLNLNKIGEFINE